MTREHVLPQWLSRAGSYAGQYILERDGKLIRTPLIEVVTKRVCTDCNSGWLARIEDSAKPVIEPMVQGAATSITGIDRWIIARRYLKTILTARLAGTSRQQHDNINRQPFSAFYSQAQPFINLLTLMWCYEGPLLPIRFDIYQPDAATGQGVLAFFHFHGLILAAYFTELDKASNIVIPRGFDGACHVIWPPERGIFNSGDPTLPLKFPTPFVLDKPAVEVLHGSIAGRWAIDEHSDARKLYE